jgi:hypothetical protein
MTRYDVYRRWKSRTEARGVLCTLTFKEWCAVWDESHCYEFRGRNGYVMAQSVSGDGFVPGNVEIVPAVEVFKRSMDAHYGGERDYIP